MVGGLWGGVVQNDCMDHLGPLPPSTHRRKRFCPAEGGEETPQQRIWFFKNTAKDVDGKRARPPLVLAPGEAYCRGSPP